MVPTQSDAAQNEAIASIPRAVRTVNLSVLISLLSLVISLFTLFWNIRPARVEPFMSEVFASEDGGLHLSMPLSIVNRGAHSATVLAAKVYESDGGLVQEREAACGTAAAMRRTVAIEDVRRSPLFNVQSTPMFSGSGELLGIVSTHYQRPHKFTDHELDLLGYLAARTALMIDAFALLKA